MAVWHHHRKMVSESCKISQLDAVSAFWIFLRLQSLPAMPSPGVADCVRAWLACSGGHRPQVCCGLLPFLQFGESQCSPVFGPRLPTGAINISTILDQHA